MCIRDRWCVEVDWIQVILDGGSKDSSISGFDLTLGTPTGTAQVLSLIHI